MRLCRVNCEKFRGTVFFSFFGPDLLFPGKNDSAMPVVAVIFICDTAQSFSDRGISFIVIMDKPVVNFGHSRNA